MHPDNCRSQSVRRRRSSFILHHSSFPHGFTLIEFFLTLAVLTIVLGMMMNLANRVRREAAEKLTRQLLARLTTAMSDYQQQYHDLPAVQPITEAAKITGESITQNAGRTTGENSSEITLAILARQNNIDFVRNLHLAQLAKSTRLEDAPLRQSLDHGLVVDPWGSPIVFMPKQHPLIGMAPDDAPFFLSAGPDRQYLTREDNVYSYEGGE